MTTNKQDTRVKWERKRVQRVLDYHNKKYRTHITIKGKSINVFPKLKGQLNWDWVCYDMETCDEIAMEIKRITEQKLEKKAKAIYNLLHEVRLSLLGLLTGEFLLSVNVPDDYSFPLRGQPQKKQILKDVISRAITEASQRLDVGETQDLAPHINERLPFELPNIMFFDFHKLNNEGNGLVLNPMIGHSWSIGFDEIELEKFEHLVSYANKQLEAAHTDKTILILIEEGYRPIDPPEIAEAFANINAENYSEIRQVYFVRGEEITEIPLPTP